MNKTDGYSENCLGETEVEDFLNQYWQKKPLLVRNAFPAIKSPLTADELAGLACEEHVNARLVIESNDTSQLEKPWQLEFGPFDESRFNDLPESHWSLLVSDVERHLPETRSLLKPFRFIPDWRIDDLMISYAPPGGSVGAHVDAYDVFLIQLSGQRLWKISEHFSTETLTDIDLSILKDFTAEQEWILNAGDMLYLPPNVAHHGIAQGCKNENGKDEACMTASVGFRAPSINTMCNDYVHFLSDTYRENKRYHDTSPTRPIHHAEISDDTVSHFIGYLKQGLTFEHEQVKQWLGQYCSDNKAFEDLADEVAAGITDEYHNNINYDEFCKISSHSTLIQSPYANFLFSDSQQSALLFVNGNSYQVSRKFAETICEDEIDFEKLKRIVQPSEKSVLLALFNTGAIITD